MKRSDTLKPALWCLGMSCLLPQVLRSNSPAEVGFVGVPESVSPAPVDIAEPLDPAKVASYYAACRDFSDRRYRERYAGRSPRAENSGVGAIALKLELVPFDSAANDPDGTWQSHGKFVGVIKNYGEGSFSPMNIIPASTVEPGVTCVWFGYQVNTTQLYLRLITPSRIVSIKAIRESGHVHLKSYAEWREKTDALLMRMESFENSLGDLDEKVLQVTTARQLRSLIHTLWYTCDGGGCCKQQ